MQVQYQQTHPVHPPERVLGLQGVWGHKEVKAGNAGALKVCTVELVFIIKTNLSIRKAHGNACGFEVGYSTK